MHTPPISALSTDFYQFTMSQGYFEHNMHELPAVFHLFFRTAPFKEPYAVCAGLASVIEFLETWHFQAEDMDYLASLQHHEKPIFSSEFLNALQSLRFSGNVHAIPEGTLVFPHEPLLRLEVPLWIGQLLETPLLTIINFQTLIASKAAKLCMAARGKPVYDFGLRRAQGWNGGLMASRGAYIGGVHGTSNVLAGQAYDIPVMGTHAHSWVSAFPDELSAFRAYADRFPNDCVLLVDTYNTISGIQNAVTVGLELKQKGFTLRGIRLDSGNLIELSTLARTRLNEAGLFDTKIIASNSLNEFIIADLLEKNAPIDVFGVGTQLVTAYDEPALNGVYKLSLLKEQYKFKTSDEAEKQSMPGRHQVRRFVNAHHSIHHDVIYDIDLGLKETASFDFHDLLVPVFENGQCVYRPPTIHAVRARAQTSLGTFDTKHSEKQARFDPNVVELRRNLLF